MSDDPRSPPPRCYHNPEKGLAYRVDLGWYAESRSRGPKKPRKVTAWHVKAYVVITDLSTGVTTREEWPYTYGGSLERSAMVEEAYGDAWPMGGKQITEEQYRALTGRGPQTG